MGNDLNAQNCWLTLARLQIDKALEAYEVAGLALENGKLISAVNRLYYVEFYAASALLQIRGEAYAKHTAVRAGDYKPETRFDRVEIANPEPKEF